MKVKAIFGPPGTGKTRTLVGICESEIEHRPLFLSYTRAAAAEAVSRLSAGVRASTIHSMAFNALGMNRASVVDRKKLAEFGKAAGIPFMGSEIGSDEPQEGDEFINVLAFANNSMRDRLEAYDMLGRPGTQHRFEMFCEAYIKWKRTFGFMDFDDMLMKFIENGKPATQHEVVLLDEAQDCSAMQWAAMEVVIKGAQRVYIAGDDDQAIYEWNGANPHGMVEFGKRHKGSYTVLDQSHRVPRVVHKLAHKAALAGISKRVDKKFKPTEAEGSVTRYGDLFNFDMEAMDENGGGMILVRDRFRLNEAKTELNRLMIPYDVLGGLSPWTSKMAQGLRDGKVDKDSIPLHWRSFYRMADLRRPIKIILSTIHQSKGRENKRVVVDLTLTGRALLDIHTNPDAERRVLYVALTRTSDELHLTGSNPLL